MDSKVALVVDDEKQIRSMVRAALESDGFHVREASSIHQLWQSIHLDGKPDILLLDLGLPDGDGLEAADKLTKKEHIPIIMLSGRGSTLDKVKGLELGADDYLSKPFELTEMMARVKSVLRRAKPEVDNDGDGRASVFSFDSFTFNADTWELSDDRIGHIELTQYEAHLLSLFLKGHGAPQSRTAIAEVLGGRDHHPLDRSIDNLVSRLRKKLSLNPDSKRRIRSIRGVGYQFMGDIKVL